MSSDDSLPMEPHSSGVVCPINPPMPCDQFQIGMDSPSEPYVYIVYPISLTDKKKDFQDAIEGKLVIKKNDQNLPLKVKGFDDFRVIIDNHRLFKMFFGQVAFMFGLQILAEADFIFKIPAGPL